MRFRAAIERRWCDKKGHKWSDWEPISGIGVGVKVISERTCARCGRGQNMTTWKGTAGTDATAQD